MNISKKEKRKLDQNRSLLWEQRLQHLIERINTRYNTSYIKEDVLNINNLIKSAVKGKLYNNKEIGVYNLYKRLNATVYLVLYKDSFFRSVWDIKLSQTITFLPLYENPEYFEYKIKNNFDLMKNIKISNEKAKSIIDNHSKHDIVKNVDTKTKETIQEYKTFKDYICQIIK